MVSIRGRILTGRVVSTKMHRTIIIRREYLHYVPKYNRYEKRHKNLAAHVSPCFRVEEGDMVVVGQCRPLSKTVRGSLPVARTWSLRAAWCRLWCTGPSICCASALDRAPFGGESLTFDSLSYRSASTFSVSCPAPVRPSRRSTSSKRLEDHVSGGITM